MKYQKYIDEALRLGAVHAVPFELKDICFDSRTLLKCMFGCSDWGKNHTCPSRSGNATIAEYKEMLSRYKGGIIIHSHEKAASQRISFAIEQMAFTDGEYFAFSMSDCSLCTACSALNGEPCRNMKKARPAFHSVGIDVFKTVRGLNLPINTLSGKESEQENWYSAVFVD